MKIRDRNATLEGDETCYVMPSGGLEVVGEDGRALFSLELKDGILKVQTGTACKHGGKVLDNRLVVIPHSANYVSIARPPYEAKLNRRSEMCQVGAVWASWMAREWMPIATAPRDGTEVLVVPNHGYDRALFQDGFWFWSTLDGESTAAGPEPKGWKPLPFNAKLPGGEAIRAER